MHIDIFIQFFPFSVEPRELAFLDSKYQEAYRTALAEGKMTSFQSRVMIVGHSGAGKTSLLRCLLGMPFEPKHIPTIVISADTNVRINEQADEQADEQVEEQADGKLQVIRATNWTHVEGNVFVIPQMYIIIFV